MEDGGPALAPPDLDLDLSPSGSEEEFSAVTPTTPTTVSVWWSIKEFLTMTVNRQSLLFAFLSASTFFGLGFFFYWLYVIFRIPKFYPFSFFYPPCFASVTSFSLLLSSFLPLPPQFFPSPSSLPS
jgi:hypothetical protein